MSTQQVDHAWGYLIPPEVRFLDAAVSRLIPADELGPGAREARVTVFIDRQMCTPYGVAARLYRQGPWHQGTPQQGPQCPLTPREIYRIGIREVDEYCVSQFDGRPFSLLKPDQQDTLLKALEKGKIELQTVEAKMFFDLLLRNTMEGFFTDPMYGGNHDKMGWRLIGFPGVAASDYASKYMSREYDNKPYQVEPVSILDIVQGRARTDAEGFPVHVFKNSAKTDN